MKPFWQGFEKQASHWEELRKHIYDAEADNNWDQPIGYLRAHANELHKEVKDQMETRTKARAEKPVSYLKHLAGWALPSAAIGGLAYGKPGLTLGLAGAGVGYLGAKEEAGQRDAAKKLMALTDNERKQHFHDEALVDLISQYRLMKDLKDMTS